jgi:hypothetical protein
MPHTVKILFLCPYPRFDSGQRRGEEKRTARKGSWRAVPSHQRPETGMGSTTAAVVTGVQQVAERERDGVQRTAASVPQASALRDRALPAVQ